MVRDSFGFERDALEVFKEVERVRWESRGLCKVGYEKSVCGRFGSGLRGCMRRNRRDGRRSSSLPKTVFYALSPC